MPVSFPARDYLTEAREYACGERRALPSVELVIALVCEIDRLHDALKWRSLLASQTVRPDGEK